MTFRATRSADNEPAVCNTRHGAISRLVEALGDGSEWTGELSSSALATATAACALELVRRSDLSSGKPLARRVARALDWIAKYQNKDGGWGDTVGSPSNLSTTTLCWVALGMRPETDGRLEPTVHRCEVWLSAKLGDLTPSRLSRSILRAYGRDRTFSVPILTMCALGGRFGEGRDAWKTLPSIPFELAACPPQWFNRIGLPMVSYALPALISMGHVRHHRRPTRNPALRALRNLTRRRTLGILDSIQPAGGGFLEAAPLTSFVTMSLVGAGCASHPVTKRGVEFLERTVRSDGSWPIDTNLSTWLTTLTVNALDNAGTLDTHLDEARRSSLLEELLRRQFDRVHPYTRAAPGGWAWTDLSGGVPDADDTAGALLALAALSCAGTDGVTSPRVRSAASSGVDWLVQLQNRDGGIPTFCRGWGKLPFDRSSPDLTAHALRAWARWRDEMPMALQGRIDHATCRAVTHLLSTMEGEGCWVPLWFGNQRHRELHNPLYGTSRVLLARGVVPRRADLARRWEDALQVGATWIRSAQNDDGGWGGAAGLPSSIEETAMAIEALSAGSTSCVPDRRAVVERGLAWLDEATQEGTAFEPTPIGLYFAKLWYSEKLYPLIFTVSALERWHGEKRKGRS